MALDSDARVVVNKLGAILRVANALDADHLQKVRDVRLLREDEQWVLEVDGGGDLTLERLAALARADMLTEVFGSKVGFREAGGARREAGGCGAEESPQARARAVPEPRAVLARVQRARARGGLRPRQPAARAAQVRLHRGQQPRRVLHGAGGGAQERDRGGRHGARRRRAHSAAAAPAHLRARARDGRAALPGAHGRDPAAARRARRAPGAAGRPRRRGARRRLRASSRTRCCPRSRRSRSTPRGRSRCSRA